MNILSKLNSIREASRELRALSRENKDHAILKVAEFLLIKRDELFRANEKDLKNLDKKTTSAFRDRLLINSERVDQMVESLRKVAQLPDPVGEVVEERILKNALKLRRVRAPLGVILMIFESRPNVAIEAWSLAFKSGNAIILRGGRESKHTTAVIYKMIEEALKSLGFTLSVWGITDPDRRIPSFLLKQNKFIDVVVPRGGDGLINFVVKNSKIPIIKNDRGLCHVYVAEDASIDMAINIVVNGKTSRPGVCNSIETLLVHEDVAAALLPRLHEKMDSFKVQWHVCPKSFKILKGFSNVKKAVPRHWDTEYLDFTINCKVVTSDGEAFSHIEKHGSKHSECIVTQNQMRAKLFQNTVDAAAVYWNASTRFTDGFEFGLGGELGISTQKLHVRGPVGLRELTSCRWIIDGAGQVRT